jgi:hypothetical protein
VKTVFIAKGSTWENGYVESFNSRFRDELLNREHFVGLEDARWVVDRWRLDYNHQRAHSSLGYQTPAEFAAALLTQILLFRLVHRRGEGHTETVLVKALPNWWTDLDRDRIGHNWNAVLEMK